MMQTAAVVGRTSSLSVSVRRHIIGEGVICLRASSPQWYPSTRFGRCFAGNLPRGQASSCSTWKGTNSAATFGSQSTASTTTKVFSSRRTQSLTPLPTSSLASKRCRLFTSASSSFFRTSTPRHKQSTTSPNNMPLKKDVISEGDGKTYPKAGDTVSMEYTGTMHRVPWSCVAANAARLAVRRVRAEKQRQAVCCDESGTLNSC